MGRTCALRGCLSTFRDKTRKFFKFPQQETLCRKWIEAAGRPEYLNKPMEYVSKLHLCDLHFTENDRLVKNVKKNVVPSLNLPQVVIENETNTVQPAITEEVCSQIRKPSNVTQSLERNLVSSFNPESTSIYKHRVMDTDGQYQEMVKIHADSNLSPTSFEAAQTTQLLSTSSPPKRKLVSAAGPDCSESMSMDIDVTNQIEVELQTNLPNNPETLISTASEATKTAQSLSDNKNNSPRKRKLVSAAEPVCSKCISMDPDTVISTASQATQTPKSLSDNSPRTRKLLNALIAERKRRKILEIELEKASTSKPIESCNLTPKKLINSQSKLKMKSRGNRYAEEFKMFASNLYFASPLAYRLVSESLNLPSERTMRRINKNRNKT